MDNSSTGKAVDAVEAILSLARQSHFSEIERLCTDALSVYHDQDMDTQLRNEADNRLLTAMQTANFNNLEMNHCMRFGIEIDQMEKGRKKIKDFLKLGTMSSRDYENVIDFDTIRLPIVDICITYKNDPPPEGFYKISLTPSQKSANIKTGTNGKTMYFCIKKAPNEIPISSLVVILPDRNEHVPPGFSVVKREGRACNLNTGTNGERMFLCFKRDAYCNPITDLQVFFPTKGEIMPQSFNLLDRSIRSIGIDLNLGTGAPKIAFSYHQSLFNLECLRISQRKDGAAVKARASNVPSTVWSTEAVEVTAMLTAAPAENAKFGISSPMPANLSEGKLGASVTSIRGLEDCRRASGEFEGIDDDNASVPSLASDGDNMSDDDDIQNYLTGLSSSNEAIVTVDDKLAPLSIRRCLHPILACLFVRQGNLFNLAVDSLELLLTKTNFFNDDFKPRISSASKTTIDLVIDCLCERLDIYHENTNQQVMLLLKLIIERSRGSITRHSIKKIFRATTFVSSCYAAEKHWIAEGFAGPLGPKGERLLSFEVLKALIQAVSEAAETVPVCTQLPTNMGMGESTSAGNLLNTRSKSPALGGLGTLVDHDYITGLLTGELSENVFLIHGIVTSLVSDIVDTIELSHISESALQAVSKRSFTTASPKFWIAVETCSRSLFAHLPLRNAHVFLAGLCKVSFLGLGGYQVGTENGDKALQYLGNKLFALEAIRKFCQRSRYKMKMSKLVGYQVRRLVVPCILANMEYALVEPRVFVRLMKLMSVLWHNWREHIRVEFSVLCEQVVLRVLNAPPQRISPIYSMIALTEIYGWFEQPHLSLEMFVNYDMHLKFVADWNIFSHLSRAVCSLAKNCSKSPSAVADGSSKRNIVNSPGQGSTSQLDSGPLASTQSYSVIADSAELFSKNSAPITYHDVRMMALEVSVRITRSVMDASGHANMVQQADLSKSKSSALSQNKISSTDASVAPGWIEREITSFDEEKRPIKLDTTINVNSKSLDTAAEAEFSAETRISPISSDDMKQMVATIPQRQQRAASIKFSKTVNIQSIDLLSQAVQIYREKDSMMKAVKFLVSKNFMSNTPQEYASFVRLYKKHFDPSAIGDFLGEGGRTKEEEQFWDQTRYRFTRAISFVEMDVESALRLYFTGCGFRLPGEAQKIDRFVTAFVLVYWQDNMSTSYCPYRQQDTVHLLSYAMIMLNTDLHRANAAADNRRGSTKIKQMTKEQFIHNLRGVDVDKLTGQKYDIGTSELNKIYENILARPIEMVVKMNKPPAVPMSGLAASSENFDDSAPINPEAQKRFAADLLRGLRSAGELLRDQANIKQRFFVIGVDTSISLELVQFMFEAVWHDFYDVTDGLLTKICSEENVLFSALEILANALSVCIFLDMKVERISFVTQLINFKTAVEKIESSWATAPLLATSPSPASNRKSVSVSESAQASARYAQDNWFEVINNVTPDTVMIAIKELHRVIVTLKDTIQICARHEATKNIMGKIEKRANIQDPNRFIIKDGDLNKRCRNAKIVNYHFFLFSDLLIYAHFGFSEYKVHVQLPLEDMKVALVDPADDPEDRSFFIEHPIKSFAVEAGSAAEKRLWMRELSAAIDACIKRRSRSLSLFDRFQEQGEKVTERQKLHHDMMELPLSQAPTSGNAISILKRFSLSHLASVVGGTSNHAINSTTETPILVKKTQPSPPNKNSTIGPDKKEREDTINPAEINLDFNSV